MEKISRGVPSCTIRPPSIIAMRPPSLKASSRSWLTKMMVRLRSRCKSSSSSCRRVRISGSKAENGSSIKRIGACVTKARASPTLCCMPPDSSPTLRSAQSESPTSASCSSARARRSFLGTCDSSSARATLSRTVRQGSRPNCWNTMETHSRRTLRRSFAEQVCTLADQLPSFTSTWPRTTGFNPLTARSRVDLPDPDRPMSTRISPSATSRVQLCTPST